uniref:Uncharacterized protein n=1 Tax=Ditylenchus dipsaci TaxID=166011 RepID=A0A915DQL4_9BILA
MRFYQVYRSKMSLLNDQVELLVDCLDMLLIKRRKLISLKLLCFLAFHCAVHVCGSSWSGCLVEEDGEEAIANGVFQPDSVDPDCTRICSELKLLSQHSDRVISAFSKNIVNRTPSTDPSG